MVNRKSPTFHLWTSVTKEIPAPGRKKLNTRDRSKVCQAGPRWRLNSNIAWHTERLIPRVLCKNSKRSPSSNATRNSKGFEMCNSRSMLVNIIFSHIWKPWWSRISIFNKMAAPRSPCGGIKTRVLHFKVKNTKLKEKRLERECSKECSFFFLWRKGSFSSRNGPSTNLTLFSSRRSAWSVLKCNQGSEVFAEFSGTFCTLWAKKITFLKENICIYKCFIDVLYIFSSAPIWDGFCVEFCHVFSRVYLRERIHDPDSV